MCNVPDLRALLLCMLRGCKLCLIFISFYSIVYSTYMRTVYHSYLSVYHLVLSETTGNLIIILS